MMHRLRYSLRERSLLNKKFEGITEMDETFVGWMGGKNRHKSKKGIKSNQPVFGMICRTTSKVRTQDVENVRHNTLLPIIENNVANGRRPVIVDIRGMIQTLHIIEKEIILTFSVNHRIRRIRAQCAIFNTTRH